jgi:mannan endo-1,4-beta-mannosidase
MNFIHQLINSSNRLLPVFNPLFQMKNKKIAIVGLLLCCTIFSVFAQTRTTFYVQGRHLYDRCGEKTILRGVNEMSIWAGSDPTGAVYFPEIKKTGANCVRIVWLASGSLTTLDQLIQNCINQQMIPMIELHDATSYWSKLNTVINRWVQPDMVQLIKKHEAYLLVNIANETGGFNEQGEDDTDVNGFIQGYTTAIQRMRAAGISTPLIIDANGNGKNIGTLNQAATPLLAADPAHNLMFSVHLYWAKNRLDGSGDIATELQKAVNLNYPLIIGEFSKYGAWNPNVQGLCNAENETDVAAILTSCQQHELGWLAWSWGMASNIGGGDTKCVAMDMATNGLYNNLQAGWATDVVNALRTTVIPKSMRGQGCNAPPPALSANFTSCANSFFQAMKNLVANVGTTTCGTGTNLNIDVFGEMTDGCYGGTDNKTGRVSFTMFKSANKRSTAPEFRPIRVIWGSKQSVYDYYGACTPPNLVYELLGTENHIFEAVLVPVNVYKQTTNRYAKLTQTWIEWYLLPVSTCYLSSRFRWV